MQQQQQQQQSKMYTRGALQAKQNKKFRALFCSRSKRLFRCYKSQERCGDSAQSP
jgi:hypothetical protein